MAVNKFIKVIIGFLFILVAGLLYFVRLDTSDLRFAVANNSTFDLRMMILKGADINQNIGDFRDSDEVRWALMRGHPSVLIIEVTCRESEC